MRKSVIDSLLPKTRQGVLSATLLQPRREWYTADLARHLGVPSSSLQRELASLTAAGLLKSRRQGRMVWFQADTDCPVFPELRDLLAKTAGLVDVLRDALASLAPRIRCAFVFGSVARREEASESDVDLMVIGRARLSELTGPMMEAREHLGRDVNPVTYSPEEFAVKVAAGHHFVTRVLGRPKLFVIGTQNELDRLAQGRKGDDGSAGEG